MKHIIFYTCLLFLGDVSAQQSSKSKSKDRFRERNDGSMPVRITNAGAINQGGADYAPAFYKDGVVFVSGRATTGPRDPRTGEAPAELYYAFFNHNGEPEFPQKMALITEKESRLNDGPVCFSHDNKTVFLTMPDNTKAGKDGKTMLKICASRYGQTTWTKPEALPFNSDDYSCMHPSLSADGARLFFSSDMPGGQGGYDIYVVERKGTGWGTPVNLGPLINTEKQEIFPFVSPSGTLFFSSNGRSTGLGGFDNYFVNNPLNNPEEVVNLGEGFNSSADDMSLIIDTDGKSGFFTSSRPGGAGNVDIYRFETPRGLAGTNKPQSSLVSITVSDAKTGKPLQKAEIRILQPLGDSYAGSGKDAYRFEPVQDKSNVFNLQLVRKNAVDLGTPDLYSNVEGKAQIELIRYQNYLVVVNLPGYSPKERLVSVDTESPVSVQFKLSEPPPTPDANIAAMPLSDGLEVGTTIILDNIFPEYNSAMLQKRTELYLDAIFDLLQQYPAMEIDLIAHTDTRGDARLNQELTEARAKNAKSYLLSRGIAANRVAAYGKGESEPRNRCTEGVNCSDEEHQQNNRVEIKVKKVK
ncbi:MAG TPA: OmpA family protein [Saprospiraceae bacterium]|nr:OmpA family protein [Saprospiraceae bacterium]